MSSAVLLTTSKNGCSKRYFQGFCPIDQTKKAVGELVFSTGMTGYVESLTDPSYRGQILTFTYPLIGNYGVPPKEDWESDRVQASGVIVAEPSFVPNHAASTQSLLEWLKEQDVPIMWGVDTRALTKVLRDEGSSFGAFCVKKSSEKTSPDLETLLQPPFGEERDLIAEVSTKTPYRIGSGDKTIIAVDCGIKRNILRSLSARGLRILVVPYDYDYTNDPADGIFLSNGPGNPKSATKTIKVLRKALKQDRPIFGICLGAQLMALAAGGTTYKLRFGHRGHNQPCFDHTQNRAILTAQNHGWAIDPESLPLDWEVHFTSLNDGSVEGIMHRKKPHVAVQFHPESAPGPNDARYLFGAFVESL